MFRREDFSTWGGTSVQQDYLMRQIRQLGVFLARLMSRRGDASPDEIIGEIQAAGKSLLGMDLNLLTTLSEESVVSLFHTGPAVDAGKCLIAGVLLHERGQTLETAQPEAAERDYRKALALLLAALLLEKSLRSGEYPIRVEVLTARLLDTGIPASLLRQLYRYHEKMGQYARAEDLLHFLKGENAPGWAEEARQFYERLLALPGRKLAAGGLPREEVEEGLASITDV